MKKIIENIKIEGYPSETLKQNTKLAILLDTSGSTSWMFADGQSVLKKEIEIAKQIAKDNFNGSSKITLLYTFDNECTTYGPIKVTESGSVLFPPNITSSGSTCTNKGLQRIIDTLTTTTSEEIIIITDGQTNSTKSELQNSAKILRNQSVTIKIIAVSDTNIDFKKLSKKEENTIPGLDVVNFINTEAVIYTPAIKNSPFKMASTQSSSHWTLLEVPFSKKIPLPVLITSVFKTLAIEFAKNPDFMDSSDESVQVLFIELGMYIAHLYAIIPTDFIKKFVDDTELMEFIEYGFSLKRQNKPLVHINLERQLKSSKERITEFENAEDDLSSYGTALNTESISFIDGVVCYRDNPDSLLRKGIFSVDEVGNSYFAFSTSNEQPVRQGLRIFFGNEFKFKDAQKSPSVIFGISTQIILFPSLLINVLH